MITFDEIRDILAAIRDRVHPQAVISFALTDDVVTIHISLHRLSPPDHVVHFFTLEHADFTRSAMAIALEVVAQFQVAR